MEPTSTDDVQEDRLSALPQCIQLEILSLLSLNSAIVTGALSRQWRGLWTRINSIVIDCRGMKDHRKHEYSELPRYGSFTTVDRLIQQLTSPSIHTFRIHLPCHCDHGAEGLNAYLDAWLRRICSRNVEHVVIQLSVHCGYAESVRVTLPPCILQTRSLLELNLGQKQYFTCLLPHGYDYHNSGVNLPFLKRLCINLEVNDISSTKNIAKLIHSCSSLEDLALMYWGTKETEGEDTCILDVSSFSLKKLYMFVYNSVCRLKVVIYTPVLEKFATYGVTEVCFVKGPRYLVDAEIGIGASKPKEAIFREVTGIRTLTLENCLEWPSSPIVHMVPTFQNISHLRLCIFRSVNLNYLPTVFKCFPALNHLFLHVGGDFQMVFSPHKPSPQLNMVRRINVAISHLELDGHLLDFLEYFLSNAQLLEQFIVRITWPSWSGYRKSREVAFRQKLYECPRVSSKCQVVFFGLCQGEIVFPKHRWIHQVDPCFC